MNCCNECNNCGKPKCGCPEPILSIEAERSDFPAYLRYNFGGRSVFYDYTNMIKQTETDTSLMVNIVDRVLRYMAERHIDTISAKELGSILHIADIGDVDITEVQDNSMLVYQKNSDCGQGCEGINNSWIGWNALDNLADSLQYLMGFDANGKQYTLNVPDNTNQYYSLGWNAEEKISYSQPVEFASAPTETETGYIHLLVEDPATHQQGYVKATIGDDGTVKVVL